MIANYHTHTPRCNHAQGSEQEYVDAALSAGLKILGFSDHTPYFFPGDYYSTFRMHPEELPGYVSTVNAMQTGWKSMSAWRRNTTPNTSTGSWTFSGRSRWNT